MRKSGVLRCAKKTIVSCLVMFVLLDSFSPVIQLFFESIINKAEAAVVTIDTTPVGITSSYNTTGAQTVFTSDTVGYTFYRNNTGTCVYKKTTDSGNTWGSEITVDAQSDCVKIVVWYDQWTPGDTGSYIHIATMETGSFYDRLFYNRLDTTSDTLWLSSSPVDTTGNSSQTPSFSEALNTHSITKATDGTVYMAASDGSDSFVVNCTSSCNSSTNWNEVGTSPFTNDNDHNLLMPLSGGSILLIHRDISLDDIKSSVWNGTSWSSWSTLDFNAIESQIYDGGMSATINHDNNEIYLAYVEDNDNFITSDHDIRTAVYDGSWSTGASILVNDSGRGIHDVSLSYDQNSNEIYAAYSVRTNITDASSGEIFYKISDDAMASWGSEQGPVNNSSGDFFGLNLNSHSLQRIYATWFDPSPDDWFGESISDIGPDTELTATGTQTSAVRASTSDHYIGGKFILESNSTRTVSEIEVTENGTINGQNEIANVKLFYDVDNSAPYDCSSESYSGSETQFGLTDSNGFSGADGTSLFTDSPVDLTPTETLCFYVVLDVLSLADSGDTIEIEIDNPNSDVNVSGTTVYPPTSILLAGSTEVVVSALEQTNYHWRDDNGNETDAFSATAGIENTALSSLQPTSPRRIRMGVRNTGSTSTLPTSFTLEYAVASPSCSSASGWTAVDDVSDDWDMYDSFNLIENDDTTNISSTTRGAITDAGSVFLSANGGVRDASDTTGLLTLGTTTFTEFEFSVVASTTATEGDTYCFRLSANGQPLETYTNYPTATIAANAQVESFGTQVANVSGPSSNNYFGGGFRILENLSSRNVTEIIITESGSIDAQNGIENVRLYYDIDNTAPYDCVGESYSGFEPQFGATSTAGFSDVNGTSTFSGSVGISTTSTMCVYVVADLTDSALNGDTIELLIASANAGDVKVSGLGSVSPSTPIEISDTTLVQASELTQTHYHWRNDDGDETDATSATGGVEDTVLNPHGQSTPIRLRIGVSNEGSNTSVPTQFKLEFGPKLTTCSAVASWSDVDDSGGAWDMYNSTNIEHGSSTSNIPELDGGISDENGNFLDPNEGVRETSSLSATTTLTINDHIELEYSITSTEEMAFDATYCFRLTANGEPLPTYSEYPEVTSTENKDFKIQRGTINLAGTSTTITAGVDYDAPASSTKAFVRVTNTNHTGAGRTSGGGAQDADEVTVHIGDSDDIGNSIRFERYKDGGDNTRVDWEIIEFINQSGTDNEIIVHDVGELVFSSSDLNATGTTISGVSDNSDIVVFITGVSNNNTTRNYYASQVTSNWHSTSSAPTFRRESTGGAEITVSYAVVEFVGLNWQIQRVEHQYTSAGVVQTESITPVNSLSHAFIHAQKRMSNLSNRVVHHGQTVWLSSIGAVSFKLETGSHVLDQYGVAWIIENLDTGPQGMNVQRTNGTTVNGSEPFTASIGITTPIGSLNNTSIFMNSSAEGDNTDHPRSIAGALITSSTTYQLWRSDTGSTLNYRTEIVEWPVADLAQRQNYYRFYKDNGDLTPTEAWPGAEGALGENTSITALDNPPGEGDRIRLRMSVRVSNANLPAGFQRYKLQFAERVSTCHSVGTWTDVGQTASSTIWTGFTNSTTTDGESLSTNPPNGADLIISVSDVAGTIEHQNFSSPNPYPVPEGDDIEFDWQLEHNGADANTVYCFRMVETDGTPLSGYLNYPQLRTADYTPKLTNWRWFEDTENETPTSPLSATNSAPTNIDNNDTLTLRVRVREAKNVTGVGVKFKLQYSEDITFANPSDVTPTTTCSGNSLWCYVEDGSNDNDLIQNSVLTGVDACVLGIGNGCGRHNTSPFTSMAHTHNAGLDQEYSFTLRQDGARTNAVYYFRLVNVSNNQVVALDDGSLHPSLVTAGSSLVFTINGNSSGILTAGVTTNSTTTATTVNFENVQPDTEYVGAHTIDIETNATEGYQILKSVSHNLISADGSEIEPVLGTNQSPQSWLTGCQATSTSCFGYHSTDATLSGGSTRFAPTDTYARVHTTPLEVFYSSIPTNESHDIVYRLQVSSLQPAGDYETSVNYIAIPVF